MGYIKKDRRDDERREGSSDRKPYGDKSIRKSNSSSERTERKPYTDRSDRKPYGENRERGGRGERKEGGERRDSRAGSKSYSDKPERRSSSSSDRTERKPYGERSDRKPYGENRERREGGERRASSSDRKPYGDKPRANERGSSYSTRPLRSSDEPKDRSERGEIRGGRRGDTDNRTGGDSRGRRESGVRRDENVDRNQYKPRSKKSFDEKPERGRPERRKKSDKITPHKPGAFDIFDKRYAKPNIKEEIKKERKEGRERREEENERRRGGGERRVDSARPTRTERSERPRGERAERTKRTERAERPRTERAKPERRSERKEEVVEQYEGVERKKAAPGEEIRLNKFIANSGVCSRRKADELIEKGEITVNGEVVRELGYKVQHSDKIKFEGKLLKPGKLVYVLLNKPKDYITTMDDPEERRTVVQLTAKATNERIFPVGRLDRNTTGLLLLTNDGDLADKLAHPRNQVKKIYEVELDKSLSTSDFEKIKEGVELEDGLAKPDQLSYLDGKSKKFLGIEIHIGRNRIVRRIFESLGYEVMRLDRVVYAGLTKKDLPRGRHRMLTKEEVIYLKHLNKY